MASQYYDENSGLLILENRKNLQSLYHRGVGDVSAWVSINAIAWSQACIVRIATPQYSNRTTSFQIIKNRTGSLREFQNSECWKHFKELLPSAQMGHMSAFTTDPRDPIILALIMEPIINRR